MSTDLPDAHNQSETDTNQPLDLAEVRKEIDALDLQIQSLLNQRAAAALKVAVVKLAEAAGKPVDFYRPERVAQILK